MSEHIYEDSNIEHERYHVIPFGSMREEIVRCRGCKFKDEPWNCAAPYYVEPDGFCFWGKPRGEGDTE